jgi:colanic acid/amylovoran/stewartan biosynthesis glycosyltransferase WcaL/AmsK/CpsK
LTRTNSKQPVAHVMPEYLPRSATFIYTQLRFQEAFAPVVLAQVLSNLSEFPLDAPIETVGSAPGLLERNRFTRRFFARWSTKYDRAITDHAEHHQPVALHAHFGWSGVTALNAKRALDIPLVTTFYGRDLAERKRRFADKEFYEELFEEGALFIVEGPAMADTLAAAGCPREKIHLVRIGLDLRHFPFEPRVRSDPLVIVQAARLVEKKAADLSIRAYAAARPQLGSSELWIIGDGPDRETLEALAKELGVDGSVRFFGEVSHARYRELIADAHLCLQPSRVAADGDTEGGAPTVLIEMEATGVLVVATRHADIPNVVPRDDQLADENDVDGIVEALVRTAQLSDTEWRERATEARSFVEKEHDARLIARQIEGLYSEARDRDES